MIRARTADKRVSTTLFLVLLGVVLGGLACLGHAAQREARAGADQDPAEDLDKRLAAVQAEYAKALAAIKAALPDKDPNLKKLITLQAEKDNIVSEKLNRLTVEKDKLLVELKQERDNNEIRIKKLEDKVPQVDLLAYDQPKGKIIDVDQKQETVDLNLGSADFLKMGLTFSVFADGAYKPSGERKASVAVVAIIGEHRCRARVTEINNAARRPIIKGDLLYNPAWIPGLRDHVAIAGIIDLNGDGHDNTADFVKALEKEGVIVDVWLDLKDLALKGAVKAVTFKTSFLIVGDEPDVEAELIGNRIDPRLEKKMSIRQVMHDLREDAKAKGVYLVSVRRYLALAGMKVPRPTAAVKEKKD
jgi:hypothetical protein